MNGLINTSEGLGIKVWHSSFLIKGNKSFPTLPEVFDAFERIVLMREADGKVFEVQSSSWTQQNWALNFSLHIHTIYCFWNWYVNQEEPWKSLKMHRHNHEELICSRSVWQMPNVSFKKADLVPVMMTLQTEPKEHKVPTNAGCVLNLL